MTKPIIGVTSYRTHGQMTIYDTELAVLPAQYVEGVTRAGGLVALLPPQEISAAEAEQLVSRIDGLMVTGGSDVGPARYGQTPGPHTEETDLRRDSSEDALLRAARASGIPILGICRGAQMLNVHMGGTLHQHLPDVVGHTRYQMGDGVFHLETMTLEEGSLVSRIFDGDTHVPGPVYHHQAIDAVAPGLTVSARGFDGVIQAIEMTDYRFGVAVQWHPEENLDDIRIFEAFVKACRA